MKSLVTGSSGHLGEALVRTLRARGDEVVGLDITASAFTTVVGSIADVACTQDCMADVDVVYHTATLHKPHVATHSMQAFVETNISGTLALLEAAVAARVFGFVFTSTTSMFGDSLRPPRGTPAAWVTEDVTPMPKNIYGVTKTAAEDLCQLFHRNRGLNCIILRTSRFFPEEDDDAEKRDNFADRNVKANEYLFRRVEIEDVVSAHLLAAECAVQLGFGRYIISATSPFLPDDLALLNSDAPAVVRERVPHYMDIYRALGWKMFDVIDRVYVNDAARRDLGWRPRFDFEFVLASLKEGQFPQSELSQAIGSKGYHDKVFEHGPYPVE
jgi:nucleoside-diphosphate-sugar epimerase